MSESFVLLKLPLLTEPDKQRFSQFVMNCLEMLDVSLFYGAARIPQLLERFNIDYHSLSDHQNLFLTLNGNRLYVNIADNESKDEIIYDNDSLLVTLPEEPSEEIIADIHQTLRSQSEVSDPELLRKHNERIQAELKVAQQKAAEELQLLEQELESKRAELQESIRAAEIDSLTGIYNRGAYDRRLNESVKHCQRQNYLLSLILLDLDYFKQVNDTLGHQAGDEVLKNMAKSMRRFTRNDVDYVCRMGGDEFAIIFFSNTDIAKRAAEKILKQMDGKVSIGIGQLRPEDTVEFLIARTDAALYEAKERGRGQVVVDKELPEL